MENKRLIFEKKYDEQYSIAQDVFTFSIAGGAEDYLQTIKALLGILGGVSNDFLHDGDRYYICALIGDMLPSCDQIKMIEKSQQQQSDTDGIQ